MTVNVYCLIKTMLFMVLTKNTPDFIILFFKTVKSLIKLAGKCT